LAGFRVWPPRRRPPANSGLDNEGNWYLNNNRNNGRNAILWLVVGLMLFTLMNSLLGVGGAELPPELAYSDFMRDVASGQVQEVTIQGQKVTGLTVEGQQFKTFVPDDANLVNQLLDNGVRVEAKAMDAGSPLLSILISWFPMLLLIGVWIFFMRQMQSGGGKAPASTRPSSSWRRSSSTCATRRSSSDWAARSPRAVC
jgi:ATP-dependent Zn protease